MKNSNKNGLLNKVKNKETARIQKNNSSVNNSPNENEKTVEQPVSVPTTRTTTQQKNNIKKSKKKSSNLDRVKKVNNQHNTEHNTENATTQQREQNHHKSSPLKKVKEKEGIVYDEKKYDLVDIDDKTSIKKKFKEKNEKKNIIDKVLDKKKTKAEIELDKRIYEQQNKDPDDIDEKEYELEFDDLIETRNQIRKERKQKYFNKIGIVVLLVACFYVVFLIYGLFNTPYVYNDKGKVVPEKYSVEEVRNLNEFNKVFNQYKKIRGIYEQILNLNFRYDSQAEDAMIVAADYESEIEKITTMVNQTQALEVSDSYNQIITQLDSWLVSYQDNNTLNDSAKAYCYNMSIGISQNNQALIDDCSSYARGVLYSEFLQVTKNLMSIGKTVKGADVQSLYDWSPEKYVTEEIGAKSNNVGADGSTEKNKDS